MRGRKPQSAAVKEQKAAVRSRHPRRLPEGGSAALAAGARPPDWLKKDGLKVWDRLAPTLRAAKLLTDADSATFGRYCRNFARWLKMQATLDHEGETYETETYLNAEAPSDGSVPAVRKNNLKRAHPAFLISDRLERQLLAAEDRFGLNPAERQRIFAARAQTGVSGDLFASDKPSSSMDRRPGDPTAEPAQPAEPIESPIGLLN